MNIKFNSINIKEKEKMKHKLGGLSCSSGSHHWDHWAFYLVFPMVSGRDAR
jgi:hypothetical protein